MSTEQSQISRVLHEARHGDAAAAEQLVPIVYNELRMLAASFLSRQAPGHTLQPTALVHEAYFRLARNDDVGWESRAHFMAVAARAMRQILINHARDKKAEKRGGDMLRVTLDESTTPGGWGNGEIDILAVDVALEKLAKLSERQSRIVELRFFGGLTIDETAHVIGTGTTTVEDDWRLAKAWLAHELRQEQQQ